MTYKALETVDLQALKSEQADKEIIKNTLAEASINIDPDLLVNKLLYACDVTVNFHPDRFSNNGKLIIDNLLADGEYHNQYKTGTSNGGLNPYIGGNRDSWEERLFQGAYHNGHSDLISRPKYGALNIHKGLDKIREDFGETI